MTILLRELCVYDDDGKQRRPPIIRLSFFILCADGGPGGDVSRIPTLPGSDFLFSFLGGILVLDHYALLN